MDSQNVKTRTKQGVGGRNFMVTVSVIYWTWEHSGQGTSGGLHRAGDETGDWT